MEINAALATLDFMNDDHWTGDGAPRVDVVAKLVGNTDLKRQDIVDAAPKFSREALRKASQEQDPPSEQPKDDDEIDPEASDVDLSTESIDNEALLEMGPADFGSDVELMHRWLAAVNRQNDQMDKAINDIKRQMTAWSKRVAIVERVLSRAKKSPAAMSQDGIRAVLKQAKQARAARAEAAKAFIENGTSVLDVAAALQVRSKLDQVMAARKPGLGNTRPALGLPVQKSAIT